MPHRSTHAINPLSDPQTYRTRLGSFSIIAPSREEYHALKRSIFTQDEYAFSSEEDAPVIIDAGAHIGIATLYFKWHYPQARITAIEPNPSLLPFLEENVAANHLDNVTILAKALVGDVDHEQVPLWVEGEKHGAAQHWWSTGSLHEGSWTGQQKGNISMQVPSVKLSSLLSTPVDLLKLDIEGAECAVLQEAGTHLHNVKHVVLECHPRQEDDMSRIKKLLTTQGFTITDERRTSPGESWLPPLVLLTAKRK